MKIRHSASAADLPRPLGSRPPLREDHGCADGNVSGGGEDEGKGRRKQAGNKQREERDGQECVCPPVGEPPADKEHGGSAIQRRLKVGIVRRKRIPVINPEDLGERRKQKIEVELRGGRRHQPGESDHARQRDDADSQLGRVNGVGHDTRGLAVERKAERQRTRIEPGQVREIHRAHSRQHAVRTEVERLAKMKDGLDVPFGPIAVNRPVERGRHALEADDHQELREPPKTGHKARRGRSNATAMRWYRRCPCRRRRQGRLGAW